VAPEGSEELEASAVLGELVVPAAARVRHNYQPAAATGNIILLIAAERPTETAPRPIVLAVRLAATPSPTGKPEHETRLDAREEIFLVIAPAQATA